jgi:hypothetical protein
MEKTKSSLLKIISENYKNKLHLLKSDPSTHIKTLLLSNFNNQHTSENSCNLKIQKIFIPKTYNKPNSYQNCKNFISKDETQELPKVTNSTINETSYDNIDLEISEEVDHSKFNFTKKDKRETLLAILNEKIIHQQEEIEIHVNDNSLTVDLIAQNIFPLSNLHLLLLPRFSEILPQFLNSEEIWLRIFNFQEMTNEEDLV